MKPSDDLFNLIRSLKKSERAAFRMYAGRHVIGAKNNYLKLFDAIDSQKKYDEEKIREKFKSYKLGKNLHVVKNYLFNLILRVLRDLDSNKYGDQRLFEHIFNASILNSKGHKKTALKILKKTKRATEKMEYEFIMFKILDMESTINLYSDISKESGEILENIIIAKRDYIRKLHYKTELKYLFDKQNFLLKKRSNVRTKADEKGLLDILNEPILLTPNEELSWENIFYKYVIRIKHHVANGNMEKYKAAASEVLNIFDSDPELTADHLSWYFPVALQYLDYCISYGYVKEFEERLPEYLLTFEKAVKSFIEKRYVAEHRLIHLGVMLKYYNRINNEEQFVETVDAIDRVMNSERKHIPAKRELNMSHTIADMIFSRKMFERSLYWVNKILNYPPHPAREDAYQTAMMLNVLIHYELGNYDLVEYAIANAEKHFRKTGMLLETERTLLSFMKRIMNITGKEKMTEEFSLLNKKLEILSNTEREKTFFTRINIRSWVDKKIGEMKA